MKYEDYAVAPQAGRFVKENGTEVNLADILEDISTGNTVAVDVAKQSKGAVTIAHEDISATATSDEIYMAEYNTMHVQVIVTGTGTWAISLYGSAYTGGTFALEEVNGSSVEVGGITENKNFVLPCAPKFAKIVATETGDGATISVFVTPLNT